MSSSPSTQIAPVLAALAQGRLAAAGQALAGLRRSLSLESATVAINALLQQRPDWIPALHELGHCMLQMQQYQAAFNIGGRVSCWTRTMPAGVELQVLALEYSAARPERVLPLRRRLSALKPDSAADWFLLAITASRVGYYAEMHDALDAALRLNSDLLPARWAKFLTPRDKFFGRRTDIDVFVQGCFLLRSGFCFFFSRFDCHAIFLSE